MRVLFVSNDDDLRHLMVRMVEDWGSTLVVAASVEVGREAAAAGHFDMVAVDVSPGDDGVPSSNLVDLVRSQNPNAHIVVVGDPVTRAQRDRILSSGVDDYVVKPLMPAATGAREQTIRSIAIARGLWERIAAVGRRSTPEDRRLRLHGLEIDPAARTVTLHGVTLVLTAKEFELLTYLAARPGLVFSRDETHRRQQRHGPVFGHQRSLRTVRVSGTCTQGRHRKGGVPQVGGIGDVSRMEQPIRPAGRQPEQ